jgi:hypothetical protein
MDIQEKYNKYVDLLMIEEPLQIVKRFAAGREETLISFADDLIISNISVIRLYYFTKRMHLLVIMLSQPLSVIRIDKCKLDLRHVINLQTIVRDI